MGGTDVKCPVCGAAPNQMCDPGSARPGTHTRRIELSRVRSDRDRAYREWRKGMPERISHLARTGFNAGWEAANATRDLAEGEIE